MIAMPITDDKATLAIRRRVKDMGLTQIEFARRVGRVQSWVSSRLYVDPGSTLRYLAYKEPETLERLLNALNWTVAQLNAATGLEIPTSESSAASSANKPDQVKGEPIGPMVQIRFGGPVTAGFNGWGGSDMHEYIEIPEMILAGYKAEDCFALIVEGDSMMCEDIQKAIPEGSIAVFHEHLDPDPNEIICAYLEHPEEGPMRVLKKHRVEGGWVTLNSLNRKVKPLIVDETMNSRRLGVFLLSINPGSRIRHRMATQKLVRKLLPDKGE
jgi:repressor LexA